MYVRFLLPLDMRERVGSRFLVRSLANQRGDRARLTAARLGYALAQAIVAVRKRGADMDAKKLIEQALAAAARGDLRPYDLNVPGVVSLRAEGPEDHALAMDALERIGLFSELGIRVPPDRLAVPAATGPMLHASIDRFLKDFLTTGRAAATELETKHSLTLFRDLLDDVAVADLGATHIDQFRDCLAFWPARARVLRAFKGLSARAIIEKAKGQKLPGLNVRTVEKHLDRLRVFFNSLVQRGELVRNPLSGLRLQTAAAKYEPVRRGFDAEELSVVFDPERRRLLASDDAMYWQETAEPLSQPLFARNIPFGFMSASPSVDADGTPRPEAYFKRNLLSLVMSALADLHAHRRAAVKAAGRPGKDSED